MIRSLALFLALVLALPAPSLAILVGSRNAKTAITGKQAGTPIGSCTGLDLADTGDGTTLALNADGETCDLVLDGDLLGVADLPNTFPTIGFITRTGGDDGSGTNIHLVTLMGDGSTISVDDGDGQGDPVFSINPTYTGLFPLLAGRTGSSNNLLLSTTTAGRLTGSSDAGDNLELLATSHATTGLIDALSKIKINFAIVAGSGQSATHRALSIEDDFTLNASNTGVIRHAIADDSTMTFNASPGGLSGIITLENFSRATATANGVGIPGFSGIRIEFNALGDPGGGNTSSITSMAAFTNVMHPTATTGTFTVTGGVRGLEDGPTLEAASGATLNAVARQAVYVPDVIVTGAGTVSLPLNIGLDVADQTTGTLRAAVRSLLNVSGTAKWAIYASGTAPSLFGGPLYGSTATAGSLTLDGNSADQTGSIILDSKLSIWPSISAVSANTALVDLSPTVTMSGTSPILQLFSAAPALTGSASSSNTIRGFDFSAPITFTAGALNIVNLFISQPTITLNSTIPGATTVYTASGTIQNASAVNPGTINMTGFAESYTLKNRGASSSVTTASLVVGFQSGPVLTADTSGGTATITLRQGVSILDVARSGAGTKTLPTNIGVEIAALTADTLAVGIRSAITANSARYFLQDTGGAQSSLVGKFTKYNNVTTAGFGVPTIVAVGRPAAGQTAAVASVATYTVGAADGTFLVSANVLVTTSTVHSFTVAVDYTDEGNTARTLTLTFSNVGGTLLTTIANAGGAVPYEGIPLHIRAKASTAITVKTVGTFTTVTYNVEGQIVQVS